MYIIIVGCSKLGIELAKIMSMEGNDVVVIDKDLESFTQLEEGFNGLTIKGDATSEKILITAGIEKAEAFVALTDDDNINILSSHLAKKIFKVPQVVVKIYDPTKEKICQQLGLETVGDTSFMVELIKNKLITKNFSCLLALGNGELEIMEIVPGLGVIGKSIKEIHTFNKVFFISAIIREGMAFLAEEDEILQTGDVIVITVKTEAIKEAEDILK